MSGARPASAPTTGQFPQPGPIAPTDSADWLLNDSLDLGALPSAVPCARLHTRAVLAEWDLAHLRDTAELVISELVTNALQATWAANLFTPVTVHLASSEHYLRAGVWDALPQTPTPDAHDTTADHGRGLHIVAALSHHWATHHPGRGGKIVCAFIAIHP
jgi:anti-sigma regulatory factor (Ser/Thr protein kinase)